MTTPVTTLSGVTPRVAALLARLGIETIDDLVFHLPLRYEDKTYIRTLDSLVVGEAALIEGVIQTAEVKVGKRRTLVCLLTDDHAQIMLRFFHFYPPQRQQLQPGVSLRCFGEVRQGPYCLEMVHPEYQVLTTAQGGLPLQTHLTPIYPTTEGLQQNQLRALIDEALTTALPADYLPAALQTQFQLITLAQALHTLHHPPAHQAPLEASQQRLAFEELLAQHLSLYLLRARVQQQPAPQLVNSGHLTEALLKQLPFQLTSAQKRVYAEIAADLRRPQPMQRLVQGDVGAGKTVVAALSALQAIESGYQVAVMAPTELLAEQHQQTLSQWLTPLDIHLTGLTGRLTKKKRQHILEHISRGDTALVVGTHALFQKQVEFARLGLIIVDEQHRFGVHQRLALRHKGSQKGLYPHQLIMTATPIPRTLAMTAYADLDSSVIDEMPPGRTPITTVVMPNTRRLELIARIRHLSQQKRQAYWVCTLIEESEALQCQAAEETAQQLQQALPELRLGLVHGRLKSVEKEQLMANFKSGIIDLLVATTVIEVGVDVPNASLMIIENAERLGLAQLHQLRGRIGRGWVDSYCVLLYQPPLSELAQSRLAIIRQTQDGFVIAQRDLELRGPGEVLGTRQTGLMNLRVADLHRDKALLPLVTQAGKLLFEHWPKQGLALIQRWVKAGLDYGDV